MSEFLQKGAKRALSLVKNKFGIYPLKDWDKNILSQQFANIYGIYILENTINNKLLIGEGNIGSRIRRHLNGESNNSIYKVDFNNGHKFRMIGYIPCDDIEERKELEFYLHKYYKDSYNKPVPPKHLFIKLYEEGKNKKEIQQILECCRNATHYNIKIEKTSKKSVSYIKEKNTWVAKFSLGDASSKDKKEYHLGVYATEEEAAQNRDYFIYHKDFLDKTKLNYNNIDYNKFKPHLMPSGKMNQYIEEIYNARRN